MGRLLFGSFLQHWRVSVTLGNIERRTPAGLVRIVPKKTSGYYYVQHMKKKKKKKKRIKKRENIAAT
jgi:hypothetical protein